MYSDTKSQICGRKEGGRRKQKKEGWRDRWHESEETKSGIKEDREEGWTKKRREGGC